MKKLLTLLLAAMLLLSLAACTQSGAETTTEPPPETTTAPPPETTTAPPPETTAAPTEPTTEPVLTDEEQIKQLLTTLFDAKRGELEDPFGEGYDFSPFWLDPENKNKNITYFERYVEIKKKILPAYDMYCTSTSTKLTYRSFELNGDTALVEVYEDLHYTFHYYVDGSLRDHTSGVGIPYTITLEKVDSEWLISDIYFYDEGTEPLRDSTEPVEDIIARAVAQNTVPQTEPTE